MRTLDRYLLREALGHFALGLAVLLLLFWAGAVYEVLAPLVAKGGDPYTLLLYLLYRTPEAVVRGAPVAYLFALLLLLSRMAEDAELKALLALGVRRERVLLPLLALGGGIGLLAFALGEGLVPRSLAAGQDLLRRQVLERPRALLTPGTAFQDAKGRVVYVGEVEGERIGRLRVLSRQEVLVAEGGRFQGGVLRVEEGLRVTYQGDRPRTLTRFQGGEIVLKDLTFDPWQNPANRMTLAELRREVERLRALGLRAGLEATTYHRRFAEPLAAPVFALFAAGLAFYLLGGSRSLGLVGVAVLTFFYYAAWSVGRIMGEQNALDPLLAAWGPNLVYGALGLLLFLGGRR
ncbi:LptF/LptG family permease [Thermus thermamylovorans]|uniref:YjgP/YjgQ family permease n=1 Tax=Thermus thermamylovorans TaxID=2509362 RepID=A0A4Q9B5Y6_9DEIN|nr:LptF/LptG family permease [Thermus thermamylovorans]TBH21116.1 YjgP/YjgQ family permease [Thermus thermamylovorans]